MAWADGVTPDPEADALTARAMALVGPRLARVVGRLADPATRARTAGGESVLGDLVADAQRRALSADVAFMNPGGLRADLPEGPVTWGGLFMVHPFGNRVVAMTLEGAEIVEVLEQQWQKERTRILQVSGLRYAWGDGPVGAHVREVEIGGRPIEPARRYVVAVNDFLAGGGDGFTALRKGRDRREGPLDLEALEALFAASGDVTVPPAADRIRY